MFAPARALPRPQGGRRKAKRTRDNKALLTVERRDKKELLGLLGGKREAGESLFQCIAREAKEESGDAVSSFTLARLARGAGMRGHGVYFDGAKAFAVAHDLVVPVDADVDTRFDAAAAKRLRSTAPVSKKRKRSKTEQVGLRFVPLDNLRDREWRGKNMHFHTSVLVARLMHGL